MVRFRDSSGIRGRYVNQKSEHLPSFSPAVPSRPEPERGASQLPVKSCADRLAESTKAKDDPKGISTELADD